MPDIVDTAQARMERAEETTPPRPPFELQPGHPGDCDTCGEWSGRLVNGDCAPCRERYARNRRSHNGGW